MLVMTPQTLHVSTNVPESKRLSPWNLRGLRWQYPKCKTILYWAEFLLNINNRLQVVFKMFRYDKQYDIKNYNEGGNTSQPTTWEIGTISQLWCSSEDVSGQQNLSRSFHTKINVLHFLSWIHSTNIILARNSTSSRSVPSFTCLRNAARQLTYQTFWCIDFSLWCHGIIQGHKWFLKRYIPW